MTSIIKLLAFSGVDDEGPPCYMLQVDEFKFLLDCGWDAHFKMGPIDSIKKYIHQIDAVLLSQPDPFHIGALPYLVGKLGLKCPVYATVPVYKMGQMFMYDMYLSHHNNEDFNLFSLDDVDAAFERIVQLKYSQSCYLKGTTGSGLQITPLPAGYMIGGSIWKIVKDGEEAIVYGVDYNHKRERHLNGCSFEQALRPHLFITDVYNAFYSQSKRVTRDEELYDAIIKTVRNDGNVLISIDTAGRVLEVAHLLDQLWKNQDSGLMAYSLVMLSNVSYNVIEFAKSQVEWMNDRIMKSFESQRTNPFQFKFIQTCHSLQDLSKVPEPKVVLASPSDLEYGYTRDLFVQWCGNPNNCIILTSRSTPGTLARTLIENPNMKTITLDIKRKVKLEGQELEDMREKMMRNEDYESFRSDDRKIKDEIMSSSDSDTNDEGEDDNWFKNKYDLVVKHEVKEKHAGFKQFKKTTFVFPFKEEKMKWDDYGSFVDPKLFSFADTTSPENNRIIKDHKYSDSLDTKEVPTKCIRSSETLEIQARILFIDFEGRSDGASMRAIIAQVKPRQMILLRGSKQTAGKFAEYCKSQVMQGGRVLVPKLNEFLDATTDRHIYQVKLKDSVVSALKFFKLKDVEVAWLDALLDMTKSKSDTSAKPEHTNQETEPMDTSTDQELKKEADDADADDEILPTLVPPSLDKISSHPSIFINVPRLSDFKQVVLSSGIQAEMSGGVLICNNKVAVKKNEVGMILLEGTICDDYYKVRQLLYEQFTIL